VTKYASPVTARLRTLSAVSLLLTLLIPLMAVASPVDAGDRRLINDVPFFGQEEYQCGPAALAGVLNFWGVKVSPSEVAATTYSKGARGTLGIDLALYAQKRGLRADFYEGGMDDLRRLIDARQPAIIFVDYGLLVYEKGHFMVVVGYNDGEFIVNSGRERLKAIAAEDLDRVWRKTGYWTLAVRP
jgi:ABC-type bacteriocin/lantibiotic exporter with double-glycine peptidase domain